MRILSGMRRLLLLPLILFLFFACNNESVKQNVIFISLDTQRADYLSCYDPDNASTPSLDALARDGILYENCFSHIPITLPSHAVMFYSCPPHAVKVYNNGEKVQHKLSQPGIVGLFKKQGYKTAAFVSMGVLQPIYGLDKGFDEYSGTFPQNGRYYLNAAEVNGAVFPWLDLHKDQEFFLWVHYSDPHDPYYPPSFAPGLKLFHNDWMKGEFHLNETRYSVDIDLIPGENIFRFEVSNDFSRRPKKRQARFSALKLEDPSENTEIVFDSMEGIYRNKQSGLFFCDKKGILKLHHSADPEPARLVFRGRKVLFEEALKRFYREEVEYMDRQIGEFLGRLKKMGLYEKSIIVVVGDHGEGLGEYLLDNDIKHYGHIQYLHDVYLRVPLILYVPGGSQQGIRVKAPVCLLDIAPTLLFLSGLKPVGHFLGGNIWGDDRSETREIYQATYRPEARLSRFAVRKYPWHLIFTPTENKFELFDLSVDTQEQNNVYEKFKQIEEIKTLQRKLEMSARDIVKNRQASQVDHKTEEMLKALGYIR